MLSVRVLAYIALLFGGLLVPEVIFETYSISEYATRLVLRDNFYEVSPGRLYRSGLMSEENLIETLEDYDIKTVIDVRWTADADEGFVGAEQKFLEKLGVTYHHFPFLSSAVPSRDTMLTLLELLEDSEEPILVHCESGTHRSGTVSAIWELAFDDNGLEKGPAQLSGRFGYFKWERYLKTLRNGRPTLDNVVWEYLKDHERTGASFQQWVEGDYLKNSFRTQEVSTTDHLRVDR